jgi:hypothetical protein
MQRVVAAGEVEPSRAVRLTVHICPQSVQGINDLLVASPEGTYFDTGSGSAAWCGTWLAVIEVIPLKSRGADVTALLYVETA